MAKNDSEAPDRKGSGELKSISIIGKVFGAVLVIWIGNTSPTALTLFSLAMLPSIITSMIDKGEGKFASKTISACNFVGIAPYIFNILQISEPAAISAIAKELIYDVQTWVTVYGFALVGWIIIWLLPQITQIIFTIRTEIKYNRIKEEQAKLIHEWGEEIKLGKTKYEIRTQEEIEASEAL